MQGVHNLQILGGSSKDTIRREIPQSLDHRMRINKIPYIDSDTGRAKHNLSVKRDDIIICYLSHTSSSLHLLNHN